jgi:hypothetical protein
MSLLRVFPVIGPEHVKFQNLVGTSLFDRRLVSSTGSLVLFSAARVTAGQEAMWYALYGTVLWVVVGIVVKTFGRPLGPHAV